MYRILIVLIVLLISIVEPVNAIDDECYLNESCVVWWVLKSSTYCDGGTYSLSFCYLPSDPYNNDFWHYHATCNSAIVPPVIHLLALPLVMR